MSVKSLYKVVRNCPLASVIGDIGLKVQVICTDNYPLDVNFFKVFSSDKKAPTLTAIHPIDPERNIFLIFDFVHIVKSIRNN